MEQLMELKGTTGTIIVYTDRVVIKRKGVFAIASQSGFTGDRTYFYQDINSVEFKKPGFTNGYIKFIVAGTIDRRATSSVLGSRNIEDPNTVILRAFKKSTPKLSEELYNLIMEKISEARTPKETVIMNSSSNLDELKKLAELKETGVINEEEFEQQKAKLLS